MSSMPHLSAHFFERGRVSFQISHEVAGSPSKYSVNYNTFANQRPLGIEDESKRIILPLHSLTDPAQLLYKIMRI